MAQRKKVWKPRRVAVEWIDARGDISLQGSLAFILSKASLAHRETSGYLVAHEHDTPLGKVTVIAHDYDRPQAREDEPEAGNCTFIPSAWVIKIKYLDRAGRTRKGVLGHKEVASEPKSATIAVADRGPADAVGAGGEDKRS